MINPLGWEERDNYLTRSFIFSDFTTAFAFMTSVAAIAHRLNHHPEWSNLYNQVSIMLRTHDAGDVVTNLDREMAAEINKLI